jgi:hypothetical protein
MFTSQALRTVGLVWKPIKANATTKRNARQQAARVVNVESFLKKYELNAWNKTYSSRKQAVQETKVVTLQNLEEELKIDAARAAKRAASVKARALAIQQKEEARVAAKISRDEAAKALVQKLRQNGQLQDHPSF